MKLQILALLCFFGIVVHSQTTCETAKPFCAGGVSGVTFPATTSVTTAQTGPNYGCLGSTPNPSWYYLQISTSGNLDILIEGQITTPPPASPGQDVDFICWGPFSSLAGICNSLTANNTVDCSYSASFTETLNIPNGIAGEYYMVLITNFANIQQDILFTQYAGTGSTNCGLVSSNYKICAGSNATVVANNSGSLTTPSFSINPGGLTNSNGTFVVTPTVTTNYTLFVTGLNNLSQVTTQTALSTVTVAPQPTVAPTLTNTSCTSTVNAFNLGLTFIPATPAPAYTVSWNNVPNGITASSQVSLTGGINPAGYSATVTANGGCTTVANFTIDPIPEPAIIALEPMGLGHTLTCFQPVLTLTSMVASNNYTWSNGLVAPFNGQIGVFTSTMLGTWTINAVNPVSNCIASKTISIGQNTLTPTSTVSPLSQNITCSLSTITTVSVVAGPSVNISNHIYSPLGGTYTANSYTAVYLPGGPGTYTHCAINDVNGCKSCTIFSLVANQGYPLFSVSSPQNFTLGCNSKSVTTISIDNASATNTNQVPTGGAVSYTLLSPGSSTVTPPGQLGSASVYSVNAPGTWTVVTKDNTTFCETRLPISILQNTFTPAISAIVPQQILSCYTQSVTIKGISSTPNTSYLWSFPGTPGNQPGDSITVFLNTSAPNNTLIANYSLTITDENNTCRSNSVVPMFQNIFKPNAAISAGANSLTCITTTITLTNQSSTGIPSTSIFDRQLPVIGLLWTGPSPQIPEPINSTYVAYVPGTYTMIAKDLNNGCTSEANVEIIDNKKYPLILTPSVQPVLDCGANTATITANIPNQAPTFLYSWTTVQDAAVSGINTATLTTTKVGTYKLLAYNTANGCGASGEVTLANGSLTAAFEPDRLSGFAPLTVRFINTSRTTNDASDIHSIWNFGNGSYTTATSTATIPVVTFPSSGIYTVTLYAIKGSCEAKASQTITVDVTSKLVIPNIFTPNGDNINDLFFLEANSLTEINLSIFDRWGNIVYEVASTSGNVAWDGKNQAGVDLAEGVYLYVLKAKGKDGQTFDKNGNISLLR